MPNPPTPEEPTVASSPIKAKLRLVLYADDVMVADSENAGLWQYALSTIVHLRDESDAEIPWSSNDV